MPRETLGAMFLRVCREHKIPDGRGIVIITPDVLERWIADDLEPPTKTAQGWCWYPSEGPGLQILVQPMDDVNHAQFAMHTGSMSGVDGWRRSE